MKMRIGETFFEKNGFFKGKIVAKKAIFFVYIFFALGAVMNTHRVDGASSQSVSVTAQVPVSSEYAFAIQKNSSISLTRQEEQLVINGTLRGPRDVALEKHKILLQIKDNLTTTILLNTYTETNHLGVFSLIFPLLPIEEKNVKLSLLDVSFDAPLLLLDTPLSPLPEADIFEEISSFFLLTERKGDL